MSSGRSFDAVVGSELAGYQVEALIGRGGMGAVYRAHELALGRKVALKVIAPELAQDTRFRERFLRESRVAASLDHPHIVPIFKAGDEEGVLFLAMRYVEGTDLAKLLHEGGALAPVRAIALLGQVADALDVAHEKGLVHRDVKPSNVLVARAAGKETCYLADFGLTKRTGSLSGISAPGDVVGTLEYVAPEQITGDEVEAPADLYSLGCVLYECLTGQSPFPRATDVALLWAHVHDEPPRPSEVRPELPQAIDGVLARALDKDPLRRYGTAGELVAAARSALGLVETAPAPTGTRRWMLPVAALALATAAALAFVFLRDSGGGLSAISANSVGVIDPTTNELVAEVPVGIRPGPVAAGEGAVWAANLDDETVSRIDPQGLRTVRTIPAGGFPADIAAGEGSIWVLLSELAQPLRLTKITPEFTDVEPLPLTGETGLDCGAQVVAVAVGGGRAWITCDLNRVAQIDLGTGAITETRFDTEGVFVEEEFSDIAAGLGSAWIVNRATNAVTEIDPTTNRMLAANAITVGESPAAIVVGFESLWVANRDDDTVSRIEIRFGQAPAVTAIAVGDGPVDVAVGEGSVWVANSLAGTVSRIDPETNEVVATIEVGERPQRIAAGQGGVWVTLRGLE